MAHNNNNAAYDLSLFDEETSYGSAAPKRDHADAPEKSPSGARKKKLRSFSFLRKSFKKSGCADTTL